MGHRCISHERARWAEERTRLLAEECQQAIAETLSRIAQGERPPGWSNDPTAEALPSRPGASRPH